MTLPLPPAAFATEWAAAWNDHDLPRILSHYAEDVRFRSTKAQQFAGQVEIAGKAGLSAYWQAALTAQPDLHFRVTECYRGPGVAVITYLNHDDVKTAETLVFGSDGLVSFGAACRA